MCAGVISVLNKKSAEKRTRIGREKKKKLLLGKASCKLELQQNQKESLWTILLYLFSLSIVDFDKNTFTKIVRKHESDKGCKVYTTWHQFIWMIFCHLGACRYIRDISHVLESLMGNCLHLGLRKAPSKSSIAYQNAHRS